MIFLLQQQAQERFDICKKCPNLQENFFCKLCGCYMKLKVKLPQSACPENKWQVSE